MALALAERYSALSVQECLRPQGKAMKSGLLGNPLVDMPLFGGDSFTVPPGIEVRHHLE